MNTARPNTRAPAAGPGASAPGEGKPLLRDFIAGVLVGVSFLWGDPVHLETSVPIAVPGEREADGQVKEETPRRRLQWKRFRYTMQDKTLTRKLME